MQIKKNEIGKIFKKLGLEVRSTKHRYGWFTFQERKILRVHYSHGKASIIKKIPLNPPLQKGEVRNAQTY